MKKTIVFSLIFFVIQIGQCQLMQGIEFVSPFHEGLAAIKKNGQWGFIDEKGKVVIAFRSDLVMTNSDQFSETKISYPRFFDKRCMVKATVEGIDIFGFIDQKGELVIKPNYVAVHNFKNGHALVMQFSKKVIGENTLLGKEVVNYQVEEFVIDTEGKVAISMMNARNMVPDKLKSGKIDFQSALLGSRLVGLVHEDGSWSIYEF